MKSSSSASKNDRNEASNPAEEISFQPEEQHSYDAASRILSERRNFFGSLPSIVSMKDVFDNDTSDNSALAAASQDMFGTDSVTRTSTTVASAAEAARHNNAAPSAARAGPAHRHRDSFEIMEYRNTQRYPSLSPEFITLATPTQGHHELENALEKLEGLEKEESTLVLNTPLIRHLTELVTGEVYLSSTDALHRLEMLGRTVPRRVCQHPFRKNDIVWVCRTCQADETCVLCHNCFSQSNHEGHDVAFYHAQAGGCCDCGDPDGTFLSPCIGYCSLYRQPVLRLCCFVPRYFCLNAVSFSDCTLVCIGCFLKKFLYSTIICKTKSLGSSWILSSSRSECNSRII